MIRALYCCHIFGLRCMNSGEEVGSQLPEYSTWSVFELAWIQSSFYCVSQRRPPGLPGNEEIISIVLIALDLSSFLPQFRKRTDEPTLYRQGEKSSTFPAPVSNATMPVFKSMKEGIRQRQHRQISQHYRHHLAQIIDLKMFSCLNADNTSQPSNRKV